jgi:hypothetical protein
VKAGKEPISDALDRPITDIPEAVDCAHHGIGTIKSVIVTNL